jgi:glycosyltransferase involved in cell wall biosynthesis
MRIAILAHGARFTGGRTVGLSMIDSFSRVAADHDYLITIPAGLGYEDVCAQLPHVHTLPMTARGIIQRLRFDRGPLLRAVREYRPNVVFALSGQGLADPPCPQAIFPQDPHLIYPVRFFERELRRKRLMKRYHKHMLQKVLRRSQMVFCQTSVVEQRIRQTFGYKGKARVIYSAPSQHILQPGAHSQLPAEYRPYADELRLLYPSAFYAHKNVEAIADVFTQYGADLDGVVAFITVTEQQHPRARPFLEALTAKKLANRVVNLGQIPHETIGAYYAHADALLMPTFLETFGLPYVEAMSYGLPILTSDLDFAHSVCGDAALFFNPWDVSAIRDSIVTLRDDPDQRRTLSTRSKERLHSLVRSWDDIATDVVEALLEISMQ